MAGMHSWVAEVRPLLSAKDVEPRLQWANARIHPTVKKKLGSSRMERREKIRTLFELKAKASRASATQRSLRTQMPAAHGQLRGKGVMAWGTSAVMALESYTT